MEASSIECNILLISIMNKTVLNRMEASSIERLQYSTNIYNEQNSNGG